MNIHHSIFELHFLRIAKFALGLRQFIAAFNEGIYSVPPKCREINFTNQSGNKLPHSKERCHARKSKIHFNIFELKFSVFCTPFEVGSSMLNVRSSYYLSFVIRMFTCSIVPKSRLLPPNSFICQTQALPDAPSPIPVALDSIFSQSRTFPAVR